MKSTNTHTLRFDTHRIKVCGTIFTACSLQIEKNLCEYRNISVKFLRVYVSLSSRDLFIFFLFYYCVIHTLVLFLSICPIYLFIYFNPMICSNCCLYYLNTTQIINILLTWLTYFYLVYIIYLLIRLNELHSSSSLVCLQLNDINFHGGCNL